jgi:hypothetical protein
MLIRTVDIPAPTHYRWGPMSRAEDMLLRMIQEREARLNAIADRNIFYEQANPNIKKAYDDAKAANGDHLLNPPMYPDLDQP